jgi:hypothetical protein
MKELWLRDREIGTTGKRQEGRGGAGGKGMMT